MVLDERTLWTYSLRSLAPRPFVKGSTEPEIRHLDSSNPNMTRSQDVAQIARYKVRYCFHLTSLHALSILVIVKSSISLLKALLQWRA